MVESRENYKFDLGVKGLSVESNAGMHWFSSTLLSDWCRKLAPHTLKTNTNHNLVASFFLHFMWLSCFYFEFLLALQKVH